METSNKQGVINLIKFHLSTAVWQLNGANSMTGKMKVKDVIFSLQISPNKISASCNGSGIQIPHLLIAEGEEARMWCDSLITTKLEAECGRLITHLNKTPK